MIVSNVTNREIADMVAIRLGLPKRDCQHVMSEIMQVVGEELANGNNVTFTKFWSVQRVHKPARMARNPRTGEPVTVPERTVLKLRKRVRLWEYQNNPYSELTPEVYKQVCEYREKHGLNQQD